MIRLSGAILLLALAGCAGGPFNPSLGTQKVATISQTNLVYDLRLGRGGSLRDADLKAFEEYLAAIRIGYGDRISIDDDNPYDGDERRAAIAAVVAKFGMLLDEAGPVAPAAFVPGVTRVVITRARAQVAFCPDWRRPSEPETEFSTMSNYGCATQSNLAAMVADANDLTTPETYPGAAGETVAKAITAHRGAAPTGGGGTVVKQTSSLGVSN